MPVPSCLIWLMPAPSSPKQLMLVPSCLIQPMPVLYHLIRLTLLVAMTNSWQKQLSEGGVYSGSGFEAAVHHGKEGIAVSKGLKLGAGAS